ncbi:MAG: nicotinamidase-like amidase [Verrucomicrobiales bacterium]|nr:nicotinamidase-like amidase [Verrucomicrobiales bacterium]
MKTCLWIFALASQCLVAEERTYENRITRIKNPKPLLNDLPQWVEPIRETNRFEAPILVDDKDADLSVRAWRFSYNARGIIEIPNRLRAKETAVIMVHPWGTDDGQGWSTPEPAGAADFCTPEKNHLAGKHTREVINPFLKSLRSKVGLVMYSLPGKEDPIRKKMFRSFRGKPTETERAEGAKELKEKLTSFHYRGEPLPPNFKVSSEKPVADYFKHFKGLDATDHYDPKGFWDLPIPLTIDLDADPEDVMIYDGDGYPALKKFLQEHGIRNILLTGYCTDMCYAKTCAGYENLDDDFNVFLVGDATLATFPSNPTPRFATNAHISYAALEHLVTQISWIRYEPSKSRTAAK